MEVRNVGDFLPVQDNSNAIVVAWGDKYFPRGQTVTRASLYAFGGILNFEYVSGNKGVRTIHFWPEDILVDQSQIDEGKDCLRDRALYLRQILHDHGWRLHDPDQRGSWHLVPFVPDKLYEIYAKVTESSDAEVTLDTSPGEDEIEVFTPEANDLLNHLPSRFFAAEAKIEENTERIDNARDEIEQRLMQEVQQLRIETLQGDKFALQRIRQLQEFREREESEIDQVMIHPRKARAMEGYQ
jgi:hypothetical protein